MINNPELIKQIIDNIKKLSKEDLDEIIAEADKWYNREVTDTNVGDIENLKTLLFQENLTQYGKRKLINYYEEKIKELKEQLEYDKTHIFTPITINLNYIPKQKIKAEKSFDYYMFEHEKTRGKNKGQKGYGWASGRCRWCTTLLKNQVINKYLSKYKNEGYIEYIGIAYDEQDRIKNKVYPLVDWKMTEKDCLEYCYSKGFNWGGLYEHLDRVSCWCCPLKRISEYKVLYKYYPELWKELKEMDKKANNRFRKDYTVEELEKKFLKEKENE